MDKSGKPHRYSKEGMEKKTREALKNDARKDGPTSMYIPNPDRLSKGKYKGTR